VTEWSYGVTTCPQRLTTLLPKTLESLTAAGFDQPRLFVGGDGYIGDLPATQRNRPIGGFFNWLLGTWELFIREPDAVRYAMFEDDFVMCKGVREYLEKCTCPVRGYLNLFTFATNENKIFGKPTGWHKSDQLGKGAVALVLPHDAMVALLQQFFVYKPQVTEKKPHLREFNNTDGAIQHALIRMAKFTEYVHNPSLVQHVGRETTLGNARHPDAKTFPGEDFDARSLLK
jgi:hypothetical protein